ncbi:hypothetical protein L486_00732 [Kwoniella mangroviensis CBS 10435]|uniref:Uncharacterized protein n=1 Tax=Kwoniella mangroviensis CBS 10435 TaxID=1331196 RepID=A0A1B9IZY2_9TREE|nr:uncharacterized protein I203_04264 [Kwoniella mangroviensis CBS 8507]OCF61088.1 hypothetical protein L486_00732 [Kwoniella mangroviensis CBS 10435]OCF66688.1 hypothetical protein I203_04264 [Kwoniella mangroviensis CBS 8507]OCF74164.1 hypothetical protein I204_04534 [Kwoniella mangroviensis CBS 8886]
MSENNNGSNNKQDDPTNNPLFGAPPPSSTPTTDSLASRPTVSQGGPSTNDSFQATTDPLFGASPPQDEQLTTSIPTPTQYHQPIRRELRLYHPPRPASPSRTLLFIRRLTYILSILLGLSSAVAGIWSIFILPLLHSSFSARKALVVQQTERVNNLLEGIRKLRALGLYPKSNHTEIDVEDGGNGHGEDKREEASLKEISSSISSLHSEPSTIQRANDEIDEIIPITPLTRLISKLKILSSSMDATSTTRLSVISTLEGYTSSIHHQLFLSRSTTGGMSSYGVNMNSLSNHLNQDKNQSRDVIGGTGEEWDNTRKEIRAIKGLLLNRRQFVASK